MDPQFGFTQGPCNTKFAPLAALGLYYQRSGLLQPLHMIPSEPGRAAFSVADKLLQVLVSILAGCQYIWEVNASLRTELALAHAWGFERYLEQSSLATALNELNRTQLALCEQAVRTIWRTTSQAVGHDWRSFLCFDLDLSGLPCGKGAEQSQKGYFSGKKTPPDANWPEPAPSNMVRPSGQSCSPVLVPARPASSQA